MGNGVSENLAPPSITSRPAQQNDSQLEDDSVGRRPDEYEEVDEVAQLRSSGRRRQKSQKVLEQEAVQPKSARTTAPKQPGRTKRGTSEIKSIQDAVSEENRTRTTAIFDDTYVKAPDERAGESVTKPSPKSERPRRTSNRRPDADSRPLKSAKSRRNETDKDQINDPNSDRYIDQGDRPGQIEDDVELAPGAAAPDSPSIGPQQSEHVHIEPQQDASAINSGPTTTIEATASQVALLQKVLLERITSHRPIPLTNLDDEYTKIHDLVSQTVSAGQGNSMLIIGARGSGKTALVNTVISHISKDHKDDFHVIRLNGFIQTDDKLALREIWRQLGREMEVEDEGDVVGKNYADTLATLLALLSHPSELVGQETDAVAKSVVFVMDEFDLFAVHPRQTLLYNLFDIAQSRKAPIAVLGLTTRLDVAEGLEKRVKSRWSHRYVHVPLSKSLVAFRQVVRAALAVETEQLKFEERAVLAGSTEKEPSTNKRKKKEKVDRPSQDVLSAWNSSVDVSFLYHSHLHVPSH